MTDRDEHAAAKDAAMHALGYRFRGEEELRKRLVRKGHRDEVVSVVLNELRAEGWLDDERFAREVVRSSGKRWGPVRLERKLRELGVDSEAADRAIAEVPADDQEAVFESIVEKKLSEMERRGLDGETAKRRLASFLERRGFAAAAVREKVFSIDWSGRFGGNDPTDEPV